MFPSRRLLVALGAAVLIVGGTTVDAEVKLTINGGQVSLVAKDATVRQILEVWAKVGQTRIVNLERISGTPLSLQLESVAEQEALDIVLRSVSGYIAAPRAVPAPNASRFDRILVLPTSVAPPAVPAARPAPAAAAAASQPPPTPMQAPEVDATVDDDDDGDDQSTTDTDRREAAAMFSPPQADPSGAQMAPGLPPGVSIVWGAVPPGTRGPAPPGSAVPSGTAAPGMIEAVPQTTSPSADVPARR